MTIAKLTAPNDTPGELDSILKNKLAKEDQAPADKYSPKNCSFPST